MKSTDMGKTRFREHLPYDSIYHRQLDENRDVMEWNISHVHGTNVRRINMGQLFDLGSGYFLVSPYISV